MTERERERLLESSERGDDLVEGSCLETFNLFFLFFWSLLLLLLILLPLLLMLEMSEVGEH